MKIQFLNGGLANQVFQYIFMRYAQLSNPNDTWYLDDSFFFVHQVHNGYELESVFGLKPNLLSRFFEEDVWEEMIRIKKAGRSIPQTISDMGIPIEMITEASNYTEWNPFDGKVYGIENGKFIPEITQLSNENLYYHGYWINKNWFASYKDVFLKELQFPVIPDEKNREYAKKIQESLSVGIHIRRGDFVALEIDLPVDYYQKCCKEVVVAYPQAELFVFSDDVEWCCKNAAQLGLDLTDKVTYITGNVAGRNYIDLQLMSMCKGLIMSNSSFSYLSALLDTELQFYFNPTKREI